MFREFADRMQIISENTTARVFSASYWAHYFYPYVLQRYSDTAPSCRHECYEYFLDSEIGNTDITNEQILRKAAEMNAHLVAPKDYADDPARTFESVKEFVRLYNAEDTPACRAKPVIVLQPPYKEQYLKHQDFYDQFSHFGLGGLQSLQGPEAQLQAMKDFREVAGMHCYVHAFGVGTSLEMIKGLRENPHLVDSLDISTAENAIKNNLIPDKTWRQTPFFIPRGTASTNVRARFAHAVLHMLNYMLGPRVTDNTLTDEYHNQTTLGELTDTIDDVGRETLAGDTPALPDGAGMTLEGATTTDQSTPHDTVPTGTPDESAITTTPDVPRADTTLNTFIDDD